MWSMVTVVVVVVPWPMDDDRQNSSVQSLRPFNRTYTILNTSQRVLIRGRGKDAINNGHAQAQTHHHS